MKEVIKDTLIDSLNLLPFLFVAFLLIEIIEHKIHNKKIIHKAGCFGPLIGSLLGIVPQCGFSVSVTNLYATRIVSLGTLIAVYLSTSDEMLPILIGEGAKISLIVKVLLIKLLVGMVCGFLIDLLYRKKEKEDIENICEKEHCHCEKSLFMSTFKHTLHIFFFILIISFLINVSFAYLGNEFLAKLFMKDSFLSPFITSLFGLIPNCASSVAITEFYLNNTITFGSMVSGLLTGSGVAIMVLFKINRPLKDNFKIVGLIYMIGVISGLIINLC